MAANEVMDAEPTPPDAHGDVEALTVIKPTPLPVFTGHQMSQAITAYRELQRALDQSMPDQIMDIQGKKFRKKGYWRSVATAFNLRVECVKEERVTRDPTADAGPDWGWLVTYRATAPHGRFADGDGACFASEKNRGRMSATEHNVRSHANTRAYNRAVSNLVAFGEVSAEEVDRGSESQSRSSTARQVQGSAYISDPQANRLQAIARSVGWQSGEVERWLLKEHQIDALTKIPRSKYDAICKQVEQGAL